MSRMLLVFFLFAATAVAAFIYRNAEAVARASDNVAAVLREHTPSQARAVKIARGQGGEFALHAKINGATAPMVVDTGATSVVLTYETAKAAGLPLELLEYDVDVETAALDGRDFVIPDDVKELAADALSHRLILSPALWSKRVTDRDIIASVVGSAPVPKVS